MPRTKSAKKTLRSDLRKRALNLRRLRAMRQALKKIIKAPEGTSLSQAFKQIDKAAKEGVIHKNKAARLKSRLSKKLKSP